MNSMSIGVLIWLFLNKTFQKLTRELVMAACPLVLSYKL